MKVLINIEFFLQITFLLYFTQYFYCFSQEIQEIDTKNSLKDTLLLTESKRSGIDTIVFYRATDSIIFDIEQKIMILRGSSSIEMKNQKLSAELIELDFERSILKAEGIRDSNNKLIGIPHFTEEGEEYYGKHILYNFSTNRGTITFGETELGEGFYFGSKIKRISENELFVQNGYYTTCDAGHPHFYFGSPKMKVALRDRIFIDPIIFYIEDMPIFGVPFGLFFPSKSGRQSGIIVPSFFFSQNRGVVLNELGIYLALSDYYDTKFSMDFFSKGGFILKNYTQWHLVNKFSGNARIEWGRTRLSPDQEFEQRYSIGLSHNHQISPFTKFDASLDFRSQDYNRNTSFNIFETTQQNISSNASYSTRFEDGSSFSISFQRDQNIITDEYTQTLPRLSYIIPNLYPLRNLVSTTNWMRDITFSYNTSFRRDEQYRRIIRSIEEIKDTNYQKTFKALITHSPVLSISPKFGYFTVQPSVSFSANNYFRKLTRKFNPEDSSLIDELQDGFFTEYNYSFNLSLQTTLYGIVDDRKPLFWILKPSSIGIKALRHMWQPRLTLSYTPDQSDPKFGFYGKYYDLNQNREITYSRFEYDGGGIASRFLSQSLSYRDMHRFEIKKPGIDTLPDKNIELFELTFATNYNFAADSIRFSNLNLTLRIPSLDVINFNSRASFTLYDEAPVIDPKTGLPTDNYQPINKFLFETGKGLARMTTFGMELSTSFNSKGLGSQTTPLHTSKDSISIGERFLKRIEEEYEEADIFGDNTPGYTPFNIPWNLSFALSYSYNSPSIKRIDRNFNLRITASFYITPSLNADISTQYDLINKEFLAPLINIRKDLHCWSLNFTWYPSGFNQGFYLKFAAKSSMLSDLKFERRSSYLYR